jgi:hypothetical protein
MWAFAGANIPARYVAAGQPVYPARAAAVARLPGAAAIAGNPSVTIVQPAAGAETSDARGDGGAIALSATGTLVTIVIQWQPPSKEDVPSPVHNYTLSTIIAHN